jgi:predicted GIY-YIG superfamily endonuclease
LYRVVSNYTDGFQSRIAVARTPDNTFAPLEDKPYVLTDRHRERIRQVAHLLPLMQGEVVLPKLEAKGREWLERVRLEALKDDDKTKAQQRKRVCVITQRMTCCLMLCKVCETLIQKHGANGAEARLKQNPNLWKEMLLKTQTAQMLDLYDTIADSLIENALYFFRERIENAFASKDYTGGVNGERMRRTKNDTIFERLDMQFTFEQAMQYSVAVKGAGVTRNSVYQMLKNWRNQGLITRVEDSKFRKA